MSPMLQTNDPGIGVTDIQSPAKFLTFCKIQLEKIAIKPFFRVTKEEKDHSSNIYIVPEEQFCHHLDL